MMGTDPLRVKAVFLAAIELPDAAARALLLDRECGSDIELRQRIDLLLEAHNTPASAVSGPLAGSLADEPEGLEFVGQILAGRYKLLEKIGEGGMGIVWVAQQIEPVRRRVALKLIKAGMDTRAMLGRFEAERQALAVMDHPNIARVLDGGMTDSGRPFFVMDYVKGVPITQYCDDCRLSVSERLKLFILVCQAVQHAHQKGIIHRDLKPGNILICMYDGQPVPKVIDFGLAKAMHHPMTSHTVYTAHGMMLGTPIYMSPEQAEVNNLDIDTRSDVYTLGVLLYELLTGTTPLEKQRFRETAWLEMMRLVKEQDPPRPSARLSGSESLPSVAAQRHVEPLQLTRLVKGDLDWIVMKCLEKERGRRYSTAIGLADDIQRFLQQDVVLARPPTTWYRWQKFFRQHRGRVIAAGLFLATLIGGVIGTSLALVQARSERNRANLRLAQLEKSNEILSSIFADLNPNRQNTGDEPLRLTLGRRLEHAANELEAASIGDELTVARMNRALGQSLRGLGFPADAVGELVKARDALNRQFGPNHPESLDCQNDLAIAYKESGNLESARRLYEETLQRGRENLGENHRDTLNTLIHLSSYFREIGDLDRAMPMLSDTFEKCKTNLGADDPLTIASMTNLATGYMDARQYSKALPLFEETLRFHRGTRGPDDVNSLGAMNNVAMALHRIGQLDRAIKIYQEVLQRQRSTLGYGHSATQRTMNNLASAMHQARQLDNSIPLFEELLRLKELSTAADHPSTLQTAANLGLNYLDANRADESLPLLQRAFAGSNKAPALRWVEPVLVECLAKLNRVDEAVRMLQKLADNAKAELPAGSAGLAARLFELGWYMIECDLNSFAEAETLLRESLAIREKLKPDAWAAFNTKSVLGESLANQAKFLEAEPLLLTAYEGLNRRESSGEDAIEANTYDANIHDAISRLVELYTLWDRPDDARLWRDRLDKFKSTLD
jgi:serine/threonine protein kinase